MSAFTDQFQRRDPLTFSQLGRSVGMTIVGCQRLLKGRSTQDLIAIAVAIDAKIDVEVQRIVAVAHRQMGAAGVAKVVADKIADPAALRQQFGELSLMRAAGVYKSELTDRLSVLNVQPWEPWAVFALWKCFDYLDALEEPESNEPKASEGSGFSWSNASDLQSLSRSSLRTIRRREASAVLAAEAAAAHERAYAEREIHELLAKAHEFADEVAAVRVARALDDLKRNQDTAARERNREVAKSKNAVFATGPERAVSLVRDEELARQRRGEAPFATWEEAVTHLTQNMTKPGKPGKAETFFKDRPTLTAYLKAGGWQPTKPEKG